MKLYKLYQLSTFFQDKTRDHEDTKIRAIQFVVIIFAVIFLEMFVFKFCFQLFFKTCFSFLVIIQQTDMLFKVYNKNILKKSDICLRLIIKTLPPRCLCHVGGFFVNLEHIPHLGLITLLLTWNMYLLDRKAY